VTALRKAGLHSRNALVLTPTSIRVFACDAPGWPPRARDEIGAWPVGTVRVSAEAAKKWSAFSVSHSGSQTNRSYDITLTPADAAEPIVVQCTRRGSLPAGGRSSSGSRRRARKRPTN
jgi:hypothetical protein